MESMCQNYSTGEFTFSIDRKQGKGLFWNYPGYKDQVTQKSELNQLHPQYLQWKQVSIVLGYSGSFFFFFFNSVLLVRGEFYLLGLSWTAWRCLDILALGME